MKLIKICAMFLALGSTAAIAAPVAADDQPSAPTPVMLASIPTTSPALPNAFTVAPSMLITPKLAPQEHKFFDVKNAFAFSAAAIAITGDALSTQKGLAYPGFHEMNPIARPFVQSKAGAAVYNAGSFAMLGGLTYWAHRTGHHKLEHLLPFTAASWEGLLSIRNYHVIATRNK
ncbi:MAG TPA: hypothetical protein VFB79_17250 [Candidatus Angelobacter sp.]|nr:hypothetical protein [Candidatus Angelobacter sp.]